MIRKNPLYIAVIGAGRADVELSKAAESLGAEIARAGHILVCGGLGGVMAAAARGVKSAGGLSIGILPGDNRRQAAPDLTLSIPTGFGHGRNYLVVLAADGVIAVGGAYGTLSEAAYAVKLNKPLVMMADFPNDFLTELPGVEKAPDSKSALNLLIAKIAK